MSNVLGVGVVDGPSILLFRIALVLLPQDVVAEEGAINKLNGVVNWGDFI